MSPLEECCTTCLGCGAVWCREEITSPGEPDLCLPCWEAEDDAEEGTLRGRDYEKWANL